jgi:hypothetical protein
MSDSKKLRKVSETPAAEVENVERKRVKSCKRALNDVG